MTSSAIRSGPLSEQLSDRVAFVTGAGRGIGKGIAEVLASRGAAVALVDLEEAAATEGVQAIDSEGGSSIAIGGDVTDQGSMHAAVEIAVARLGRIDICVANAGVIGAPGYEEGRATVEEDWDATFEVNVKGLVHTAEAVIPHMQERGSGRIINIASHGGRTPGFSRSPLGPATVPYSVSKAAALQWTWHLALRLVRYNITVNAVCPGSLWTPMWEQIAQSIKRSDASQADRTPHEIFLHAIKERTPLGREQTPEDIGRAVAFLASDDARVITGQALNVNGGAVMN